MEGKADGNFSAAGCSVLDCEAGVRAVEMREAVAEVGEADAAGGIFGSGWRQAGAGVGDFEDHAAVFAVRGDGELHDFVAGLHAVAQRVFNDRLKKELRNERWEEGRIDVVRDGEFAFEAFLHQFEIAASDLEFLFERKFVRAGTAQREAEKIAELREHGVGGAHVFVHDGGNGVERIEQEMGLNLKAKIFELRLREAGLEFGGGELLRLGDLHAFEEIVENDDDGVTDEVVRILHRITKAQDAVVVRAHAEERREGPAADGHERGVDGGVSGGAEKMESESDKPRARRKK